MEETWDAQKIPDPTPAELIRSIGSKLSEIMGLVSMEDPIYNLANEAESEVDLLEIKLGLADE